MIQFFEAMRDMVASDDLPPNGGMGGIDCSFWEAVTLEPTSPLGLFVRNCVAAYYGLAFDALCRLYTEVRRYVDPTGELDAAGACLLPAPPGVVMVSTDPAAKKAALLRLGMSAKGW